MKKRILVIMVLALSLVAFNEVLDATPFFMKEISNYDDVSKQMEKIESENNIDRVYQLTNNIQAVFIKDTSFSINKEGRYYATQGHFYIDVKDNKVIYCLDPTIMVGPKINYKDYENIQKHAFSQLSSESQMKVFKYGYIANDLYEKTKDEKYLLVGQYLIWDEAGAKFISYDKNLQNYKEDILNSDLYNTLNSDDMKKTTFLDTTGQDLLKMENAPIINKEIDEVVTPPIVSEKKPILSATTYMYDAGNKENGEELIDLTELTPKDFEARAFDDEDGEISEKVKIVDTSKVNTSKVGSYPVTLSVEDKDGNKTLRTTYLVISNYKTILGNSMLLQVEDANVIGYDKYDKMTDEDILNEYLKNADIYAMDFEANFLDTKSEVIGKRSYKNPNGSDVLVFDIKNSSTNSDETLNKNAKLVVFSDGSALSKTPFLIGENTTIKQGEKLDVNNLNVFAYDTAKKEEITSKVKYDTSEVKYKEEGVFPVYLSVTTDDGKEEKFTVYVTTTNEYSSVSDNNEVVVYSRDIYTNEKEVAAQTDINKFVKENSESKAFDMNTSEKLDPNIVTTLKNTSKFGVYDADVTAQKTKSVKQEELAKREIKIFVAGSDDTVDSTKPYINADDLIVNVGDKVSNADYNAVAFDKQDGDLTSSITYESVNTSKEGVYPVKLSVKDKDLNTSDYISYVTVKDKGSIISPNNEVMLNGDNFILNELEVNSITDINEAILKNSNARAWDMNSAEKLKVSVESTDLTTSSKKGNYTATLKADNGVESTTKEINIIVKDVKINLTADDIYTNEATISKESDIEKYLLDSANIVVKEEVEKKLNPVTVKSTNLASDSKYGIYDAEFEVTNEIESATVAIKIYVAKDNDTIDDTKPYISGDNLVVNVGDKVNDTDYNAVAFDKQDGDLRSEITYESVDTSTPGVKAVKLNVTDSDSNTSEHVSYVTVKGPDSIISPNGEILLDASDIYTNEDTLSKAININKFIIKNSNAFAQNTQDGSDIDVVVDKTTLAKDSTKGVYTATLSATSGSDKVQKEINIYVSANSDVIDDTNPYISGDNLVVNVGDTVSESDYNAVAFDKQDGDLTSEITYETVDTSKVGVKAVKLSVTDSESNTSEHISYVTVKGPDSIISPNGEILLDAKDIYTNEATLSSEADINNFIIRASEAFAQNTQDGSDIDVVVDKTTLAKDSTKGVYTATLSATNGSDKVQKEINIYVSANSDVIDDINPYISGDNLVVNVGDTVNDEDYNAVAFDKQDGDLTSEIQYESVDTSTPGVKAVKLSVTDSESNTSEYISYVTVKGPDSVISPNGEILLDAKISIQMKIHYQVKQI